MNTEALKLFVIKHDIARLVVVDSSGHVVVVDGQSKLPWEGLYKSLFGDAKRIGELRFSLEGQILPQVWSQGDIDGYVTETPGKHLVGIFRRANEDAVTGYRIAQQLVEAFKKLEDELG